MDSLHQMVSWAEVQKKKKKKMWIVERKCMSVQDVILQADEDLDRRRYIAMGF